MKLTDAVTEAICSAQAADLQTVCIFDCETPEGVKVFAFISWAPGVAERAEAALRAAGVFPEQPLGTVGE